MVLQWNCRSITSPRIDLTSLIASIFLDIGMLQESWLSFLDHCYFPNFFSFLLDRVVGRGGGLITLISSHLIHSATIIFERSSDLCEVLGVKLVLSKGLSMVLVNVYFPSRF